MNKDAASAPAAQERARDDVDVDANVRRSLLLLGGLSSSMAQQRQRRSSDRAALAGIESALAEVTSSFVAARRTDETEIDDEEGEKKPRTADEEKPEREAPEETTAEDAAAAAPCERRQKAQKTTADAGDDGDDAATATATATAATANGAFLERYARLGDVFGSTRREGGEGGRSDSSASTSAAPLVPSTFDLLKDALALADIPIDDGLPTGVLPPRPHGRASSFWSPGAAMRSSFAPTTTVMPLAAVASFRPSHRKGRGGKGPWGQ